MITILFCLCFISLVPRPAYLFGRKGGLVTRLHFFCCKTQFHTADVGMRVVYEYHYIDDEYY